MERIQRLQELNKAYEENFAELMRAYDAGEMEVHLETVKREKRLFEDIMALRKELKYRDRDPCPIVENKNLDCLRCTGYTYYDMSEHKVKLCGKGRAESERCKLKDSAYLSSSFDEVDIFKAIRYT